MSPELALQLAGLVATAGVGVTAWSLKRNVSEVDKKLDRIETDVRQLSATTGAHESRLAGGDVEIKELKRRVDGLEERERVRLAG